MNEAIADILFSRQNTTTPVRGERRSTSPGANPATALKSAPDPCSAGLAIKTVTVFANQRGYNRAVQKDTPPLKTAAPKTYTRRLAALICGKYGEKYQPE
jgi:hypothetical protein